MNELFWVEIIALAVGVAVIAIETVIIFMLRKHIRILKVHLRRNDKLMEEFKENIDKHLVHLDEHSHEMEQKLEHLFMTICVKDEDKTLKVKDIKLEAKNKTLELK